MEAIAEQPTATRPQGEIIGDIRAKISELNDLFEEVSPLGLKFDLQVGSWGRFIHQKVPTLRLSISQPL